MKQSRNKSCCPHCGCEDFQCDEMDYSGVEMWAKFYCDRCGGMFHWVHIYTHTEWEVEEEEK
jgi:hypothetical protein